MFSGTRFDCPSTSLSLCGNDTGLKWTQGKSSWLVPSPPVKRNSQPGEESAALASDDGAKTAFYRSFDEVPEEYRHRIR